ncbi:MAG: hypothetical protein CMA72_04325 [Euryarchaeota archaeon]|nr:hypothetical protein [Euryarchaeota archaeon]
MEIFVLSDAVTWYFCNYKKMAHLQEIHLGSQIASGVCQKSEGTLNSIMVEFKKFCIELIGDQCPEGQFSWQKSMKVSDLIPGYTNDKCFMSPDGGLFFITIQQVKYCFMIVEDKYQGTNDQRLARGLKKQGLGNAIERVFKNLNASWHLFKDLPVSPYLVFAAGCDFHSSESIIHRVGPLSNFGKETLVWEMNGSNMFDVSEMASKIDINKGACGAVAAQFCVKTHKYDQMPHGSSMWSGCERLEVMKKVASDSLKEIIRHHYRNEGVRSATDDHIHRQ